MRFSTLHIATFALLTLDLAACSRMDEPAGSTTEHRRVKLFTKVNPNQAEDTRFDDLERDQTFDNEEARRVFETTREAAAANAKKTKAHQMAISDMGTVDADRQQSRMERIRQENRAELTEFGNRHAKGDMETNRKKMMTASSALTFQGGDTVYDIQAVDPTYRREDDPAFSAAILGAQSTKKHRKRQEQNNDLLWGKLDQLDRNAALQEAGIERDVTIAERKLSGVTTKKRTVTRQVKDYEARQANASKLREQSESLLQRRKENDSKFLLNTGGLYRNVVVNEDGTVTFKGPMKQSAITTGILEQQRLEQDLATALDMQRQSELDEFKQSLADQTSRKRTEADKKIAQLKQKAQTEMEKVNELRKSLPKVSKVKIRTGKWEPKGDFDSGYVPLEDDVESVDELVIKEVKSPKAKGLSAIQEDDGNSGDDTDVDENALSTGGTNATRDLTTAKFEPDVDLLELSKIDSQSRELDV